MHRKVSCLILVGKNIMRAFNFFTLLTSKLKLDSGCRWRGRRFKSCYGMCFFIVAFFLYLYLSVVCPKRGPSQKCNPVGFPKIAIVANQAYRRYQWSSLGFTLFSLNHPSILKKYPLVIQTSRQTSLIFLKSIDDNSHHSLWFKQCSWCIERELNGTIKWQDSKRFGLKHMDVGQPGVWPHNSLSSV